MKKKLKSRFRLASKLLKVFEKGEALRGELYRYTFKNGRQSGLELIKAVDFDGRDASEYRVREYFGMNDASAVNSDKYINVNRRVIWSNEEYDEWKACMLEDGEDEDSLTYGRYEDDCSINLDDERANLNIDVDGVIVCLASLGLWNGRHVGTKVIGCNVNKILYSSCEYLTWYCDRYNVRCDGSHHDGSNMYLYRIAKNRDEATRLMNEIYDMTDYGEAESYFMKHTKSLRPYVSNVYGWK